MPPLGVDVSLAARRLSASPLADETNPLDSVNTAEHHSTVSAILKPFPPAWRGLPVRCPKSYNLPSDAARAFPRSGFLFSLLAGETIRLAAQPWSHVKTLTRSPGGLLCLPSACDAHPFDAVSLDLPSDVVRASLSGVPNSFYLSSRQDPSVRRRGIVPYRRLHGSSRPDTALCPLISRG